MISMPIKMIDNIGCFLVYIHVLATTIEEEKAWKKILRENPQSGGNFEKEKRSAAQWRKGVGP